MTQRGEQQRRVQATLDREAGMWRAISVGDGLGRCAAWPVWGGDHELSTVRNALRDALTGAMISLEVQRLFGRAWRRYALTGAASTLAG